MISSTRCAAFADTLVIRQQDEKDPHWNESACLVLTGLAGFVCGCEHDRSKAQSLDHACPGLVAERYALALQVMQQTADVSQGVIERQGGLLTWHTGDEQSSILSTFSRHTQFLDSPAVARNTSNSSFDPMILKSGKATIYLILPHDRLVSLSRLQRLWIGTIMRRITRGTPSEKRPVLWLLDEMAHIGHMQVIEDAVTLMRGMGVAYGSSSSL